MMRNVKSEVDAGSIRPYCFVSINGLKLASPENIYTVRMQDDLFIIEVGDGFHTFDNMLR